MARLTGPDDRTVYVYTGADAGKAVAGGRSVPLWQDAALTVPADILNLDGSAIADSTVTVDATSRIPEIQYPDGVDVIYASSDGTSSGTPIALYARTDDRLDTLAVASLITSPAAGVIASLARSQSATIQNVGDSTGNETIEWLSLLGQSVAADYDANVVWVAWNDTNQAYDPPIYLVTGPLGERYTTFSSGNVTFPAASITGDLEVVVRVRAVNWANGSQQIFAGKYDPVGNQRGWYVGVSASGRPQLIWSADGTATNTVQHSTVLPFTNGAWGWIKYSFDVDNGASGNTLSVSTSADGITWTALGSNVTTAGVASIFNNTGASYSLSGYGKSAPTQAFNGDYAWVEIRNGFGGPTVVPPLVGDWDQETSMTTNTLVTSGSPTLLLVCGSQSGQNISYFNDSTRRPKLMAQYGQDLIILSDGHNEGQQANAQWISLYSTWVSNIKTLLPGVPIACVTQNPTKSPLTTNQIAVRARRGAALMTWVKSQAGMYGIDTYPAFTDLSVQVNADGIHPTKQGEVGSGLSGQEKWASYLYQALFSEA